MSKMLQMLSFNELNISGWKKTSNRRDLESDKNLINKEILLTLKNKSNIEGIVRDITEDSIVISERGAWDKKISVHKMDLLKVRVSSHPYYSMEQDLRSQGVPRHKFRFSEDELRELLGKYAFVSYDGKIIDGKIVNISFKKNKPNTITVMPISFHNKEYEAAEVIEDFRLTELILTGESENEHLFRQELNRIESDLFTIAENKYSHITLDTNLDSKVDPEILLEKLFEAKIKSLKGKDFEQEAFNYSWTQEIIEREKEFNQSKLKENIKIARKTNEYYSLKLDFLHFIIKYISEVDWRRFGITQEEGEIKSLEYICDTGVLLI